MDFIKQTDGKRESLMMDKDNFYQALDGKVCATIPLNDRLEDKTDGEISILFPNKIDADAAKATRDWLKSHAVEGLRVIMGLK